MKHRIEEVIASGPVSVYCMALALAAMAGSQDDDQATAALELVETGPLRSHQKVHVLAELGRLPAESTIHQNRGDDGRYETGTHDHATDHEGDPPTGGDGGEATPPDGEGGAAT